jgi:hypothetical protein
MQANTDKFQVLAVGKKTFDKNMKICIQNSTLSCEETVKHLGIEIDYQLNFDIHISSICRKASQQLNILKRLGRYLDRLSKHTVSKCNIKSTKIKDILKHAEAISSKHKITKQH